MSDTIIPAILRGQVLTQQGGGYLVRGQYVIACAQRERNGWYWYDIYDRRNVGHGFANEQAAFDHLAAFLTEGK